MAHVIRRAICKNLAIENDDPVVGIQGLSPVMAADEERVASFGQTSHQAKKLLPCGWVDGAAGLIQQQDRSLLHQGSGQQRPLLLTTGKAVETTAGQLVQSNLLQNSIR